MPLMRKIGSQTSERLYDIQATRRIERQLANRLPAFSLMDRAGLSVAQLASALAPHARRIWVACGPGNNGGDGLVAARQLTLNARDAGRSLEVVTTLLGDSERLPADAARALDLARRDGIQISQTPPGSFDLAIDGLLGIGARREPEGAMAEQLRHLHAGEHTVLSIDVPSGLMADTGEYLGPAPSLSDGRRHTLSLLTLKPGLFTAAGRDLAGQVWFDPLEADGCSEEEPETAWLHGQTGRTRTRLPHSAHKGSRADVVVVGGQATTPSTPGMTGAAMLAARAALHAGAGRVYVSLLGPGDPATNWDPQTPELMFRHPDMVLADTDLLQRACVVCGCGGGQAVAQMLPALLSRCPRLVLDADALNALARDSVLQTLLGKRASRGWQTVITPHPLEAARLLETDTATVMRDRLLAAATLTRRFGVLCVLKGSGTVVSDGILPTRINSSGNPALATAGTGDVLAGWLACAMQADAPNAPSLLERICDAVHCHGAAADRWVDAERPTLTANRLISTINAC